MTLAKYDAKTKDGEPLMRTRTTDERRASKSAFKDKECSDTDAIKWVASVMEVRGIKPTEAPSATAWNILVWARTSPVTKSEFWRILYVKAIPNIGSSEGGGRFTNDGHIVDLLDS